MPTEVKQSLVTLPALFVDCLFLDVLLGGNWLKAVSSRLGINRLKMVVDKISLGKKSYLALIKTLLGLSLRCIPVSVLRLLLVALQYVKIVHCPVPQDELFFFNS